MQRGVRSAAMSLESWVTLVAVVVMIGALVREVVPPFAAILATVIVLMLMQIITFEQAFQGFSSTAAIAVAAFYVIAAAVEKTGAMRGPMRHVLDDGTSLRRSLARLTAPVALFSAFVSNTPIVAMLISPVRTWSRRTGRPASKVLIPLSYASILGGTLTLIGTSTNLVVNSLVTGQGQEPLGMFSFAVIGGPVALTGLLVMVLLGPRLLPERGDALREDERDLREHLVTMSVVPGGPLDGRSVGEANLDHLVITRLDREGRQQEGADSDTVLRGADQVTFRALPEDVVHLQQKPGMENVSSQAMQSVSGMRATYYEAVIGQASPLAGSTVGEMAGRYDAAVVAMRRSGEDFQVKDSRRIEGGDTLLVLARRGFEDRWRNRTDFLLVSEIGGPPPTATRQAPIALLVVAVIVLLAAFDVLPIAEAALGGVLALVALRILTPGEALRSVDYGVVFLIAAAFGLGAAVKESGLADEIATTLTSALDPFPNFIAIAGLLALTMFLTELVSNTAAAILAFPLAIAAATDLGLDTRVMAIAVAVAASCSFITPVGYQTNTMVYGPGNYRFTDYSRLGLPMAAAVLVVATVMVLVLG